MDDNKPQGPSPLTIATGRQIAAERVAAGYSLRQLSALSGVSVESITRYEHAKREIPLQALGRIAEALKIAPSALLASAELRRDRDAIQQGENVEG